ncbi:ML domain-containing protein [Zopfochytrium polystomum]|nr:ML domain-containing protein [Zopfochytrium polystomum]
MRLASIVAALTVALAPTLAAAQHERQPQQQAAIVPDAIGGSSSTSTTAAAAVDGSVVWCGTPDYVFQPDAIVLMPDPPKRGQPLKVTIEGTLSRDVEDGAYADVTVKLGVIKLVDSRLDLCKEAKGIDLECPFKEGKQLVEHTVDIPREVPPGKYTIAVRAGLVDDTPLACLDVQFRM